ncbi:MAG: N(4)-(beta-N-acetylglucosaminyl)-L-asparaginase [Pirellulales bacterium]
MQPHVHRRRVGGACGRQAARRTAIASPDFLDFEEAMPEPELTRRQFVAGAASLGAAGATLSVQSAMAQETEPVRPLVIASANGVAAVAEAMKRLRSGADTLDAAIAGVNLVEDDPNDTSVGYGGLPNEQGVVELDSSVMHGPTADGGAVAALRNIQNPSQVARLVMRRSDHALLVGEGALQFAKAHGFKERDLLTERARRAWLRWKENLSDGDDRLPPPEDGAGQAAADFHRHHGTITCLALDAAGDLSGVTTTSGLAFKLPGRVGDSPIFGAGLFVDNEVGAAGSTGRGEANLLTCATFLVVERMRAGDLPEQACLAACRRIAEKTKMPRLLTPSGKPNFDVKFYAVSKAGRWGAASIWSGAHYALHDGQQARKLPAAYLFQRGPERQMT